MRRSLLVLLVLPSLLFAVQPEAVRVRPAAAVLAPAGEVVVADEAFSQLDSSIASTGHSTLVAWTDGFRVKAQAFGRTLQPIGERLELIAGTPVTHLALATNGESYLLLGSEEGSPALAWQISANGALLAGPQETGIRSIDASVRWNGEAYEVAYGTAPFERQLLDATGTPVGPAERILDPTRTESGFAPEWAEGDGRLTLSFLGYKVLGGIPGMPAVAWYPSLMFADGRIVPAGEVKVNITFPRPAHAVADGPCGSLFVWADSMSAVARRFDATGATSDPFEGIRVIPAVRAINSLFPFPAGRDFFLVYGHGTRTPGIEAVTISLESGPGAPFAIAATGVLDAAIVEGSRLLVSYRIEGDPHGSQIMLRSLQMPSARQRGVRR